jgi:hypothetical protein
MKKIVTLSLLAASALTLTLAGGGCARPGEFGWTPAYSTKERGQLIARNWDYEGKQLMDDMDHALMLRPSSRLTIWNVR